MTMKITGYFMKGVWVLTCVIVILVIKQFPTTNRNIPEISKNKYSLKGHLNFLNESKVIVANRTENVTDNLVEIGGIKHPLSACLTTHLDVLPSYTSRVCSNFSDICQSFTCRDVLTRNNVKKWKALSNNITADDVAHDDSLYHNLSCPEFKGSRGFVEKPLSNQSENFPIAFNILLHQSARQFEILLRSIYRPQNSYCVHVDGKAETSLMKAVESIANCFPNVFLASKREKIIYAGYTRLQADITCMSDHLNHSVPFKYLINTAAQAFPIRTVEEMVEILKVYNGSNDIEGIYGTRLLKTRYMLFWKENKEKFRIEETKLKQVPPPHDIDVVRGSAYGIFSRKFVEFIVRDQRAVDLLNWARNTYSPDELYWATLHHTYSNPHLHTPGGFSGYPSEKEWLAVFANWGSDPCSGRFVRGVCIHGAEDLEHLIKRKEFFVNKFYLDFQPLALSCLASWIQFKESCHVPFDPSYYKTLKFINSNHG